mmetsp:Transcript_26884/g.55018  ORF Transcript_26884/g.55018 Transcript_26884/m.55018 type:complete len:591 (+) Transcript_26884:132-1904(+)
MIRRQLREAVVVTSARTAVISVGYRRLAQYPNPLRRYSAVDKSLAFFQEWAQTVMKSMKTLPKAANVKLIETSLNSLSIEEKEKLYRARGLLDMEAVDKIRAETEESALQRFEAFEAEKAAKARAQAQAGETAAAEARAQAKASELAMKVRFTRGDGQGGSLVGEGESSTPATPTAAATSAGGAAVVEKAGKDEKGEGARASLFAAAAAVPATTTTTTGELKAHTANLGAVEWDADAGRVVEVDPILGHLIGRLGSRRIFLMDIAALASIPVWEKQRVYRKDRAQRIAKGVMERHKSQGQKKGGSRGGSKRSPKDLLNVDEKDDAPLLVPGVIALYEKAWHDDDEQAQAHGLSSRHSHDFSQASSSGLTPRQKESLTAARRRYAIIDGQHRVGALKLLHDKGHTVGRVVVEVFRVYSEEEIVALFCDINKAEPVRDVDLPFGGASGGASAKERDILAAAVDALASEFPAFFKESPRCRMPNLHADNLRELLFAAKVVPQLPRKTDEDLLCWLMRKNDELSAFSDAEWESMLRPTKGKNKGGGAAGGGGMGKAKEAALKKARTGNFFLGMDTRWADSDEDDEQADGDDESL